VTTASAYARHRRLAFDPVTEREFVADYAVQNNIETGRGLRLGGPMLVAFALAQNFVVAEGMPSFREVWPLWATLLGLFSILWYANRKIGNARIIEGLSPVFWIIITLLSTRLAAAVSEERREAAFGAFMILMLVNFLLVGTRFHFSVLSGLVSLCSAISGASPRPGPRHGVARSARPRSSSTPCGSPRGAPPTTTPP